MQNTEYHRYLVFLCVYRALQIIHSPPTNRVSNREPGGLDGATQEAVAYIALI